MNNLHCTSRKHRFTLFIGYGNEARTLLKRYEQLRFQCGMATNVLFLKFLLDHIEEHIIKRSLHVVNNHHTVKGNHIIASTKNATKTNDNHGNTKKHCIIAEVEKNDEANTTAAEEVNHKVDKLSAENISFLINSTQIKNPFNLKKSEIHQCNGSNEKKRCGDTIQPIQQENMFISTSQNNMSEIINQTDNNFTRETDIKEKVFVTGTSKLSGDYQRIYEILEKNILPKKVPKKDGDDVGNEIPYVEVTSQIKPIQVINKHMKHVKRDLDYYHGYISSSDKLKQFLMEYRVVTNMSFAVRSSRSYLKKRVSNGEERKQETNVAAVPFEKSDMELQHENELPSTRLNHKSCESEVIPIPISQSCAIFKEDTTFDVSAGPLRWEFILGKPSIPFTGIPFFIIGNTHYQCRYSCTRKRKHNSEEFNVKELSINEAQNSRRSMKKNCKATMCIKSVISFPQFDINDVLSGVTSKKGCRKIKASTLENVRKAVEKGEALGNVAFWISVPLPEAHSTHDLTVDYTERQVPDRDTQQQQRQYSNESCNKIQ